MAGTNFDMMFSTILQEVNGNVNDFLKKVFSFIERKTEYLKKRNEKVLKIFQIINILRLESSAPLVQIATTNIASAESDSAKSVVTSTGPAKSLKEQWGEELWNNYEVEYKKRQSESSHTANDSSKKKDDRKMLKGFACKDCEVRVDMVGTIHEDLLTQ